jgi:hypothetical protein
MVFGPAGIWARFLGRAEGYLAKEVKCESVIEGRYRILDCCSGHRGFEVFRERFSGDFSEFDRAIVADLVAKQEFVGASYEADGDDLIPA